MEPIDCLLIGHNQQNFEDYEKELRAMGKESGAYRDLNINMLAYNGKHYSAFDIFNLFPGNSASVTGIQPLRTVETFNNAIAYLGTYLHRRGLSFAYVNSFQEEKDLLIEKLRDEPPLTVAILTTLYVAASPVIEIIDFIRTYNKTARIIVGGPFVFNKLRSIEKIEYDSFFELMGADIYVDSPQGEESLVEIIRALKNKTPLDRIKNIYYKAAPRQPFTISFIEEEQSNLSENPVDWDLFGEKTGKFPNVRTALSCPFACSFCAFPRHAGKYRTMEVDEIERELTRLAKTGPVRSITFIDDTFNVPMKRFKEILKMMIKKDYDFRWNSFLRCQFIDEETVRLMSESGCESVFLGLESANKQVLQNMNKKALPEQYLEGIALLKKYNIITFGNFVTGFPGETLETAAETRRFIEKSGLDFYRNQLWYCDPVTPVYEQRETFSLQGAHFEWRHDTMTSKEACDLIEDMVVSIKDPIRYPQYYFDYDRIIQLTHKGLDITQVKRFLAHFNEGIAEKLQNPGRREVGYKIIKAIGELDTPAVTLNASPRVSDQVEFDF